MDTSKKVQHEQQVKQQQLERFQQLLTDLYGQDATIQTQPSETLLINGSGVSDRESALLRWMFEHLSNQVNSNLNSALSLHDALELLWRKVQRSSLQSIQNGQLSSSMQDPLLDHSVGFMKDIPNTFHSLSFPSIMIYLDVRQRNKIQLERNSNIANVSIQTLESLDWFEMIRELAKGYNRRCIVSKISESQAGLWVPIKSIDKYVQTLDEVLEECTSWGDALLAEVFVDAKIGISRIIPSVGQLVQGMRESIFACHIGDLNGSKNGIFLYERLGMHRVLFNLDKKTRTEYRESMLTNQQYQALGQELRETALAFFRNNLNSSETARMLYIHRNSLLYRLDKIRELTGYDIRIFEDATSFWTALMLWKIDETDGQNVQMD